MNQLDHLIVFLTGPDDVDSLLPGPGGLILDRGTRHLGQGTRNRRVIFSDCYLELVWIESPLEARASGLNFVERCAGAACPFGVVFRGRVPDAEGFIEYTVPEGPTLKILDDPALPFVAVFQIDDPDRARRTRATPAEQLNRAQVTHAEISAARLPPELGVARVSFVSGEPQLTLTITAPSSPLRLVPGDRPAAGWRWG